MAKNIKVKLSNLKKRMKSIKAKDIMTKEVITTVENKPLADIAEVMIKERISGLPVMDKKDKEGKMTGVITATDLFVVMDMIKFGDVVENNMKTVFSPTVKFAMSTDVIKIKKDTTLEEIITIMKYKNVYTLPVFEDNKMVGIIGRRDVLKKFYATVKDLRL